MTTPTGITASTRRARSTGVSQDLGSESGWQQPRWLKVLDRIEHRDPDVGLRYWGPPLWLEVTMTGPDSDRWPAFSDETTAWDWQSNAACDELARLTDEDADDDRLLAAVSRYTIENLILNAVHEIGEWFRFDGQRPFPAHQIESAAPGHDHQGNGPVAVHPLFGQAGSLPTRAHAISSGDAQTDRRLVRCLTEAASPSRFTYLPGTAIAFEATGPVARRWGLGASPTSVCSTWSTPTLRAARPGAAPLCGLVKRDVHRAYVLLEADRICRAFHVDGVRRFSLAVTDSAVGTAPPDASSDATELLSLEIDYAGEPG